MQKSQRYLLMDPRVVERTIDAHLVLGKAHKHPGNPLFGEDRPWEDRYDNGYPNVILDEQDGLYKCWYDPFMYDQAVRQTPAARRSQITYLKAMQALRDPNHRTREMGMCYAQSVDGLNWTKPPLGIIDWDGDRANNIVIRDESLGAGITVHGSGVFKDSREADPQRRYKMLTRLDVYDGRTARLISKGLGTVVSADGLRWRDPQRCEGVDIAADTHNFPLWAPTLRRYVAITRHKVIGADGKMPIRVVAWTASRDFRTWSKPRIVMRGLDDAHQIYSMPVAYHAGLYIGLPAVFDIRTDRVHTELAVSTDTRTWHRICPGQPLIPTSTRAGAYDWGCVYASPPVFAPDGVRLYYVGSDGRHFDWRKGSFCLASLRHDGFASIAPTDIAKPCSIWTMPMRVRPGQRLVVSVDVARGGSIRAAMVGDHRRSLSACRPITRTGTDVELAWSSAQPVAAGEVRLRFVLNDAKLYAFAWV